MSFSICAQRLLLVENETTERKYVGNRKGHSMLFDKNRFTISDVDWVYYFGHTRNIFETTKNTYVNSLVMSDKES